MISELGWVRWSEGKRKESAGAFYAAIKMLAKIYNESQPRHRELYFKILHVLGWIALMANGETPAEVDSNGEVYTQPFPGMVARPREKSVEFERTISIALAFMQTGLLAAGGGAYRLAFHAHTQAHELALAEGRSILAAGCGLAKSRWRCQILAAEQRFSDRNNGDKRDASH